MLSCLSRIAWRVLVELITTDAHLFWEEVNSSHRDMLWGSFLSWLLYYLLNFSSVSSSLDWLKDYVAKAMKEASLA